MKSFFQRYTESRPGHPKSSSKPSHKTRSSSDTVRAAPVASAPSEKYRSSEDKPYVSSRAHTTTVTQPSPAQPPPRGQATQPEAARSASHSANIQPVEHDARIKRSGKAPTPLSSSEHVSGTEDTKLARPMRHRDPAPPTTAPVPEVWIPQPTASTSYHASSRPSQDRDRTTRDMHREKRERAEHSESERERERQSDRERERRWEKENKKEDVNRTKDAARDYPRSRDAERTRDRGDREKERDRDRDRERRKDYGSAGVKEKERSRDRPPRDRADMAYERSDRERDRERKRAEDKYAGRIRDPPERDRRGKESSKLALDPRYQSRSRHPTTTREFLENRGDEGDSSDSSRKKLASSSRPTRRPVEETPYSRRYREPPAPSVNPQTAQQAPQSSKHGLSSSMQVHLPGKDSDRPRHPRADVNMDAGTASANENERYRKTTRPYADRPDARPYIPEHKSSGWQTEDQRDRGYRSDDRAKDGRDRTQPEVPAERTRKGSNASQNARYSPQASGRAAEESPSSHGHNLGRLDPRRHHPPSRTPSMIKLNDSSNTSAPINRSTSHNAEANRSMPPSPAVEGSPKVTDPPHTNPAAEPIKPSSQPQPYQVWHPPTPVTRNSTPQGTTQQLLGTTQLAPTTLPAIFPPPQPITKDSPSQHTRAQFLHPSTAATPRVRTISSESSRNRAKDPLLPIKSSPKESLLHQQKESPQVDNRAPEPESSPEAILPFLLRVPVPHDSPLDVGGPADAPFNKSSTQANPLTVTATIPRPPTSMSVRFKESPTMPQSLPQPPVPTNSRPPAIRSVTFSTEPPVQTTPVPPANQRHQEAVAIASSTSASRPRGNDTSEVPETKLERPGGPESRERAAAITGQTNFANGSLQPQTSSSRPVAPYPPATTYATPLRPQNLNLTAHPDGSVPLPSRGTLDGSEAASRGRHYQGSQSKYPTIPNGVDLVTMNRKEPTLLSNPPVQHTDNFRTTHLATERGAQEPQPTREHLYDPRQYPSVSTNNIRTPIQNPRLAELLSSPPPGAMRSSNRGADLHGNRGSHFPSKPPSDFPQNSSDRPQIAMPAPIVPQRTITREDVPSGNHAEPLRRRTSAQKLSAVSNVPTFPLPVVGSVAQNDVAQVFNGSQPIVSQKSNLQHQWSISVSSANATDGSQNTVVKRDPHTYDSHSHSLLSRPTTAPSHQSQNYSARPRVEALPDSSSQQRVDPHSSSSSRPHDRSRRAPHAIDNPAVPPSQLGGPDTVVSRPGQPSNPLPDTRPGHSRSRSSVLINSSAPTHTRPHHQHSSSLPVVPPHTEERPANTRGNNTYPQPSSSSVPQHAKVTGASTLARKPSEESVLKTPSSLAQSMPVSRSNSVSSQQPNRTRKTSLLGIFKRSRPSLDDANQTVAAPVQVTETRPKHPPPGP
ncbi:hypothetical protein ONZ45_g2753 [Pleurotus djamor]|nr:hypothetical protein ONZ45_g2753 [Pleurotus djamor]